MKREHILAVLFFGGVWGLSEATLGNALYSAHVPHASVPLTAIGFVVLTLARVYLGPRLGTATLIASFALLYKFLNAPFFACHLLGIVWMGICYDICFNGLKMKAAWLAAGLATYANYAGFALMITYVARYDHWVQGGFGKVVQHIGVEGSLAALAGAILVPLTLRSSERFRAAGPALFAWRAALVPKALAGLTGGLWVFGLVACLINYAPRP